MGRLETSTIKQRYRTLDVLRGAAIIAMIAYHALWDLVNIFDVDIAWFGSATADVFQRSIRWAFILLSGFCWSMGRHKLKRGLIVLGASVVITVVTMIVLPQAKILFGVLTLIGVGMLLTIPLDGVFQKIPPLVGVLLCSVLFFVTIDVEVGVIGLKDYPLGTVPDGWYANDVTAFLGFPHDSFRSSDYVPVIPWLFLYWVGYFLHGVFEKYRLMRVWTVVSCKPLEFLGRHSLVIYMAHQPVVYGVLWLLFL